MSPYHQALVSEADKRELFGAQGGGGVSYLLICTAAFTSSWTGVRALNFPVGDVALVLASATVLFFRAAELHMIRPRLWPLLPGLAATIVAIIGLMGTADATGPAVEYVIRMFLATAVIVALVSGGSRYFGPGRLRRIMLAWVAGAAVNGAAAVLSAAGVAGIPGIQAGAAEGLLTRFSGLSFHPNSLAFSMSIAAPACVLLINIAEKRWEKLLVFSCLVVVVLAIYRADSRAGLIVGLTCLFLSLVACVLASERRRWIAAPWLAVASVPVVTLLVIPSLAETRLAAGRGAQSDVGRSRFNADAVGIFSENPFFGGGVANQSGVAVPLELLSTGGIILFCAYYFFALVLFFKIAFSHAQASSRACAIIVLVACLGYGIFSNGVTERSTFWVPVLAAFLFAGSKNAREGRPVSR